MPHRAQSPSAPKATSREGDAAVRASERTAGLRMVPAHCVICRADTGSEPVAVGEDFEYRASDDTFVAVRCSGCGLVYLNPRPALEELPRIYPPHYHAFVFSAERYGLAYSARRLIEKRRVLRACGALPDDARILDVGCGDGFHLRLLREFGKPGWRLEGVDSSPLAVHAAREAGLTVFEGTVETVPLVEASYDLAFLVMTIEHLANPEVVLARIGALLRPGGRLVIVTDSTESPDFLLFRRRHWGGYHFPRHWYLFDRATLRAITEGAGLEVISLGSMMSPVNWVYSLHNTLVDRGAPEWLSRRFSLSSPMPLAFFTIFDALCVLAGRGALLRAEVRRPK